MSSDQVLPDGGVLTPLHSGPATPERIGPYRIIAPLGEGGMGVVYLAEQDEPVQREVALKVLRAGSHTNEIVARFESERQALALMDHPNITRVYDAGVTETGLPYFVMERVSGVPITEYAASHQLGTDERLRLVVQVCKAVQHAHQKGIIHRDIKPSNVLVGDLDGEPLCKVIDFGIAKAITPSADRIRLTMTGMAIGTPAYMSPEQFVSDGTDVDTRTDIYSLGITLYEMLTGVLPFDPNASSGWRALLAKRASGELPPPSEQYAMLDLERQHSLALERGTDLHALRRAIAGDLDSIVLKALEHDRELRYSSASALAADIEHYLANEPVSARPTSATYRLRKFVRRHRTSVVFATALIVLLTTVAVGATVQAQRLAVARKAAVTRQGQAEQLIKFMLGDLRDRLEPIGKLDVLDGVGNAAIAYYASVPESEASEDELLRRAGALRQLGDVRLSQGNFAGASRLMSQSLRVISSLAARDSLKTKPQLELALAHFAAGQVEWERGNRDLATSHFEPMIRIANRLMALYPDSLAFRAQVGYTLNNLGQARETKGDARAALGNYRAAIAIFDSLVARDTTHAEWLLTLGIVHNAAGVAERKLGELDAALKDHQAELAVKERLIKRDPENREWQRQVGITHTYLSDIRLWKGDAAAATNELHAANAIYTALVARDSTNIGWRVLQANNEMRLGQVAVERSDPETALRHLDVAAALIGKLLPANAANAGLQRTEASAVTARARAMALSGRGRNALLPLDATIAAGESAVAAKPGDIDRRRLLTDAHIVRGDLLVQQGKSTESQAEWTRAHSLVDSVAAASGETELLALKAGALLRLGDLQSAKNVVAELTRRGYARPSFVAVVRSSNLSPSP